MKAAGIIVEYNPFHNGHKFHIEETRKITGADYIIAVMSGNFVQRGACALLDKYTRTRMALACGADLVIELPVFFATGSAGDFASGAVSLLDKLGVVEALCFGSECGDIGLLQAAADILVQEPPRFRSALQEGLKQGLSFPAARAAALHACTDTEAGDLPSSSQPDFAAPHEDGDFLLAPNNILGLEYCTALCRRGSRIRPYTLRREGAGYLEEDLEAADSKAAFASALSLRTALHCERASALSLPTAPHGEDASALSLPTALHGEDASPQLWDKLSPFLPEELTALWQELLVNSPFLFPEDLTRELRYRLLLNASEGFERYADVSRELSDKLKKNALSFSDWEGLCLLLNTKETTYSRISRSLCHILLSITKEELACARQNDYAPYARILGFNKKAVPLLSAMKKNSSIPLISKLADAHRLLPCDALSMLQKDITAAHLYEAVRFAKTGIPPVNEYTRQIILF